MPSILNRRLTTLLMLFGLSALANAQPSTAQQSTTTPAPSTWTWLQDSPVIFCGQMGSIQSCTIGGSQIAPTTAGSVWVIDIGTTNNVTIQSVTGGGGTWIKCPNCHASDNAGNNVDAIYNLTGNAGTTQGITITLSGLSGSAFNIDFVEFLPPAGTTASLDASGSIVNSTCTTCAGVNLGTLTGTDIVIQTPGPAVADYKSVSGGFTVDYNGGAFNLNTTSGAAPTSILPAPGRAAVYASLAFKSSAGFFTPPSYLNQNSIAQFFITPWTTGGLGCHNSCSFTLPQATGAGHLLFVMATNLFNTRISTISGGGSWVIPSGANTCSFSYVQAGINTFSCAYVLSSTAGTSTINVTMNGSASTGFAFWEISSPISNSWVLDAQGSTVNGNSANPLGQPLTISGKNDVIFQGGLVPGGASGVTTFPGTYVAHDGDNYIGTPNASEAVLLNSGPTALTPVWIDPQATQNTGVFGAAFTTAGVSGAPNPPTGLAAVVH